MAYNMRQINGTDPDYQVLGGIGSGSFGVVTKVRRLRDRKVSGNASLPRVWLVS
jgi:hypothetical protein